MKKKLIRITTIPMALKYLLPGQMRFMNENGFEVVMISADGEGRNDVIAHEGCRHIVVPLTRKITPLQDLKCLILLIKIFNKEKPDIVHTHTPKAGLLGMMAAYICRVKVRIHTVAGLPMMVEKGKKFLLLKNIEKLTYASANHVWPNSDSLKNYITAHRLAPQHKLDIILNGSTNGLDLERYNNKNLDEKIISEVKASVNFFTDNIYMLCIGRLVFDKGIVELVNAFKEIKATHSNLKLILAGDYEESLDPLPGYILEQIRSDNDIIQIPWTQHVAYYMAIAHLFVFPSHREGFPNVILQAGAMGLPVICSNIPGNIDIIQHEHTGLIFPVNNTEALISSLAFALQNREAMKQMSARLHHQVIQNYRREDVWNAILRKYTALLN